MAFVALMCLWCGRAGVLSPAVTQRTPHGTALPGVWERRGMTGAATGRDAEPLSAPVLS